MRIDHRRLHDAGTDLGLDSVRVGGAPRRGPAVAVVREAIYRGLFAERNLHDR